jgi:ssDNA-binding Zn-finger/Zn-ribbon topoisomerase 1
MTIRTRPVPYCPDCGAQMKLRKPRPGALKQFDPFWGCSEWPGCGGTREICRGCGKPDDDCTCAF